MMLKFKSQAAGDLVMLQSHAEEVLQAIGRNGKAPGILEPKDMGQALERLRALPNLTEEAEDRIKRASDLDEEDKDNPLYAPVSLRHRAVPLVSMIERSLNADTPVLWGV